MTTQSNLSEVLEAAQPIIKERVENYKAYMLENEKTFTAYDIELYELDIIIDLIKAFGRYIKSTDQVQVISFGRGRSGSITAQLLVTREGVVHSMDTEVIIAGGYNIQRMHYRYISRTTLSANINKEATEKLRQERNKLSKRQRIEEEIGYHNNAYQRDLSSFKALEAQSYEEVINEYVFLQLSRTFSDLNEGGKANYNNDPAQFNEYLEKERKRVWENHLERTKGSVLRKLNRDYEKHLNKMNSKLQKLQSK